MTSITNFLLNNSAMQILDKPSAGRIFLSAITDKKFRPGSRLGKVSIAAITDHDYLGYTRRLANIPYDLLFTRTLRKQLRTHLTPALVKTMLDLAHNDFRSGGRLRCQGAMKSLTIPNTRQQKVLLFTLLFDKQYQRWTQILIGIDDAANWNSHGRNRDSNHDYDRKARNRCSYYGPIYNQGLSLLN